MTDPFSPVSTPPPGWYHAEGDPSGTHRYWDGTRWQGGPQPVAAPPTALGGAPTGPGGHQPGGPGPASAPWGAAPAGFSPYGAPVGPPAGFGARLIAYLIDNAILVGIFIGGFVLSGILGAAAEGLAVLGFLATMGGAFWFGVWNHIIRQGRTGQSIGKQQQGIKLVADRTGEPVGLGLALGRYLVGWALGAFTFGLVGLLDYLWPLWDDDKKRLTDKLLKLSVVRT